MREQDKIDRYIYYIEHADVINYEEDGQFLLSEVAAITCEKGLPPRYKIVLKGGHEIEILRFTELTCYNYYDKKNELLLRKDLVDRFRKCNS